MSKCLAIKTGENTLERTAGANSLATAIKLAVLEKQAMENFAPNDEIYITESGDFTVPFTGEYEVTVIGGGSGATILTSSAVNNCPVEIQAGTRGDRVTRLVWLEKDQMVPVVIGAGSPNKTGDINTINGYAQPTVSSFGDIQTYRYWEYDALSAEEKRIRSFKSEMGGYGPRFHSFGDYNASYTIYAPASAGGGGGYAIAGITDARAYGGGAGGGVGVTKDALGVYNVDVSNYGQSKQGCVILRFFNPEKASLPTINDTDLIPYTELLAKLAQMEMRLDLLENNGGE